MPTLPNELMRLISYFIAPWGADTFLGACTHTSVITFLIVSWQTLLRCEVFTDGRAATVFYEHEDANDHYLHTALFTN